jgi:uncharacterized membrane protein
MATTLIAMTLTRPVNAVASVSIYGYVDRPQYMPGDSGTLKIWIVNTGDEDLILKTVTIRYQWNSYYIWEGNETIDDINAAVLVGENWSTSVTFTVPTDGRATSGYISVSVETDKVTPPSKSIYMSVASPETVGLLQDFGNLVTLFTVLVVLVIVSAIIIAATLFLTKSRPQVTWKAEEKTQ